MRRIDEIIIHCTDTPWNKDFHATDIDDWHCERGFDGIGYHYVITLDGTVELGRPLEKRGAHCLGHNLRSIGICYVGGRLKDGSYGDSRTTAQKTSLFHLINKLAKQFPNVKVHGHNEFSSKLCPCFDVSKDYFCKILP